MGIYLNPGNSAFREAVNSTIYVDKSGLISYTNSVLNTAQKYICKQAQTFWQDNGSRHAVILLQSGMQFRKSVFRTESGNGIRLSDPSEPAQCNPAGYTAVSFPGITSGHFY